MLQHTGTTPPNLRLVWRALLGSLAVYAALPWFLEPRGDASVSAVLLPILTLLAAGTAVGTLVAREMLLVRPIRSGQLRPSLPEGMDRVFQLSIAFWALSESVGLYGLVLYQLSGEPRYLYLFLMAAAGLFFAHRPGRLPSET